MQGFSKCMFGSTLRGAKIYSKSVELIYICLVDFAL